MVNLLELNKELSGTVFEVLFNSSNHSILIMEGNLFVGCNDAAANLFELNSVEDIVSTHPSEISSYYQPDGNTSRTKADEMVSLCEQGGVSQFDWMHQTKSGRLFWAEVTLVKAKVNEKLYVFALVRDLSLLREVISSLVEYRKNHKTLAAKHQVLEESLVDENYLLLNEHKRAIDASSIVSETTTDGIITYVNDKFCDVSGFSRAELLGQSHNIINHPDMPKETFRGMWKTIKTGNVWRGIIKNKKKNGDAYYVDSTISPLLNEVGNIKEFIAIRNDISEMYEKDKIILNQNTDLVSGLPNKVKLESDISEGKVSALALVRVNELRDIQQAYPKDVYEEVIRKVVAYSMKKVDPALKLYRYSDSTCAISVKHGVALDYREYFKELIKYFEEGIIRHEQYEFTMSLQVGISINTNPEQLLPEAQLALSYCGANGKSLTVYSDEANLHKNVIDTINWTRKLKAALMQDHICVFGQKIVNPDGSTYSTEALMRYYSEKKDEYISPYFFLKTARKARLYPQLSIAVITKSFEHFAQTREPFSINITQTDIEDKKVVTFLLYMLSLYNLGDRVTIELVESEELDLQSNKFRDFITSLKQHGCKIAIDDFGSGYSNFDRVASLPIDVLKIDGSLIKGVNASKRHQIVVKTIVGFAKAVGVKTVAEFVDNQDDFEKLKKIGIDYYQGYLFDKPKLLK